LSNGNTELPLGGVPRVSLPLAEWLAEEMERIYVVLGAVKRGWITGADKLEAKRVEEGRKVPH